VELQCLTKRIPEVLYFHQLSVNFLLTLTFKEALMLGPYADTYGYNYSLTA